MRIIEDTMSLAEKRIWLKKAQSHKGKIILTLHDKRVFDCEVTTILEYSFLIEYKVNYFAITKYPSEVFYDEVDTLKFVAPLKLKENQKACRI